MAATFGLAYQVYNADNDAYTQVTQFEQARLDGARAFILCPLDTDMLTDSIKALQARQYSAGVHHAVRQSLRRQAGLQQLRHRAGRRQAGGANLTARNTAIRREVVVLTYDGLPAAEPRDDGMEAGFREVVPDATFRRSLRGLLPKTTSYDIDQAADRQQGTSFQRHPVDHRCRGLRRD